MSDRLDDLERRIDELRAGVRKAMRVRDGATARVLRAELRSAERAWDALVSGRPPQAKEEPQPQKAALVTVREQVHQGLRLLGAAAQPRLIVAVSDAFFGGTIRSSQLTSLRRDEERSFRSSPFGRPYYLCAALTDRLSPARGLLTLSTWPLERRVVGPLSPRVDFLTCAIATATAIEERDSDDERALRLLVRMARNIPGATDGTLGPPDPGRVAAAARAELLVHAERDTRDRAELAERATAQLGDAARLFGAATLSTIKKENAK
ncbi:unnamed protein product [[Actinomadura] parvosata subsp. kistnae]|uniref:Uncharacterized protein n=1 Tax=[Actinomadura] parvosata subsp. kistnae TaxID=1909395 RepID=A0A1V0A1N7_9ACTN|nr:hypothetical protein [Nonomuraea sp. ATCC 55076]AQZ64136.1 hypothetical protein BKM31_24115 [Nonomuraea sp. ATCC 55076]SPL87381.1 unnamed protein product [Actinomadura parvosata subsp. kistnae]